MAEDESLEERRLDTRRDEDRYLYLERRVHAIEQTFAQMSTKVAVSESKIEGLVQTIASRFVAFDRGIDLILQQQKLLVSANDVEEIKSQLTDIKEDVADLKSVKDKADGAVKLLQWLGIASLITGLGAAVRWMMGR